MVATRSSRRKRVQESEATTAVATPAQQPSPEPGIRRVRRRWQKATSPVVEIEAVNKDDAASSSMAESSDQESAFSDNVEEDSSSSSAEESSFRNDAEESEPEIPARQARRRATRRQQGTLSANSSSDEARAKRARVQTAVEIMPVAQDMHIVLGPDVYAKLVPQTQKKGSGSRASSVKMPRRKKGVKSRKEQLEGDLTDDDESGGVDPRSLPETHIDHSRFLRLFSNHPHLRHTWSSLPPPREPRRIAQPAALKIPLLPFQQEGVQWMVEQEATAFRGGILADEMGMGKTLQTIALLLANGGRPTLVVCPTVALLQWKAEIEMATDALSVFVFYGNDRRKLADGQGTVNKGELGRYDVVLTTYGVLESCQRREKQGFRRNGRLLHEKSVLHAIAWHRVVLDEAHHLKDRSSNTSRAAFALSSQHTWSLTGTPLHNRVGELYALIRLTKSDPFCMYFCHSCGCASLQWQFVGSKTCYGCGCRHTFHFSYWNMHVLKPIQDNPINSPESQMGFRKLERLLDNVMLRRTKVERAADMGLPPRIVVTRRDKFSPEEEDFYMSLFSNYQREFDTYAVHGTVLNNYANIFELITRMRLAANHPDLLRLKLSERDRLGSDGRDTLVCSLCSEEAEDPVVSKCHHVFCRLEAHQYVAGAADAATLRCPACFALFEIDLTQPPLAPRRAQAVGATLMESMMTTPSTREYRRSIVNRIDMQRWRSSTKIEALVEELSRLRQGDASIKSIVFSQFVNFLDLIQWRLNRAGFSVCRLDGRMTPTQRDAVIRAFMTKPEFTVFLVSLKAGGVALNLTEASHVYLADCWWNPSVEVQAMDRIHRMGQHRPIKVTRIVIDNSIESRIISLQVKKQLLVSSTIGRDKKSLDRLSEQDMEFLFSS
ncbi:DNA repair protein rad16 [Coemansia brasiliensis]|uniref:DNA repair protein rad16 n=1 Tax=Coemansia brasiliensis TaxID=2650707 RepID=A0A9W8IAB2_9FUNG|nr:DNA repair protein rad16 [Coemansia brasiliensis]